MTNTTVVTVFVPSWESDEDSTPSKQAYIVALLGATKNVDGGTHIKKNAAPTHSNDYDVRCDSQGNLSGENRLTNATKVYIWGYGYSLGGTFYECEPVYDDATEIEISKDTEIILWGANSK